MSSEKKLKAAHYRFMRECRIRFYKHKKPVTDVNTTSETQREEPCSTKRVRGKQMDKLHAKRKTRR